MRGMHSTINNHNITNNNNNESNNITSTTNGNDRTVGVGSQLGLRGCLANPQGPVVAPHREKTSVGRETHRPHRM